MHELDFWLKEGVAEGAFGSSVTASELRAYLQKRWVEDDGDGAFDAEDADGIADWLDRWAVHHNSRMEVRSDAN